MKRPGLVVLAVLALFFVVVGSTLAGTYNSLVRSSEAVAGQWAQVENAYQRRADLVPNLVATVQGAAAHERETLTAVTEARAKVGSLQLGAAYDDPAALERYRAAQDELSSALSRLLVVSEAYPQLRANENFLALQSQLEGTENRIAVERKRFNDAARAFNTKRGTFPTVMFVGMFGDRFDAKAYFEAQPGAASVPTVEF
ncbi:LemA family protein [Enhygromyxa salina]|uniref:LemA family protein n=1 Tax=Enhygromyxa salina TaxID=215803 RepID=A0A0C2D0C4_9BACT|nr:LemA family protein [Enhygromyxa salina]KIG16681.1 LemA family protein [Enhygromyxa salina]